MHPLRTRMSRGASLQMKEVIIVIYDDLKASCISANAYSAFALYRLPRLPMADKEFHEGAAAYRRRAKCITLTDGPSKNDAISFLVQNRGVKWLTEYLRCKLCGRRFCILPDHSSVDFQTESKLSSFLSHRFKTSILIVVVFLMILVSILTTHLPKEVSGTVTSTGYDLRRIAS
jgi:hypothetical protein